MNIPQLPPVASAVITITGVVLAVIRLLTASRPFWASLPAWLQKGLPAALVALGTVPTALQLARTWLDVAVAIVVAIGTWFTASRGDKRPPVDKDGGPRLERVASDPNVVLGRDGTVIPPGPLTEDDPPSLPGVDPKDYIAFSALAVALFGFFALLMVTGCGAAQPAPGCDAASLGMLNAECDLAAYNCGKAGTPENECAGMIDCDRRFDERHERCGK